jgi:hypothetical protein
MLVGTELSDHQQLLPAWFCSESHSNHISSAIVTDVTSTSSRSYLNYKGKRLSRDLNFSFPVLKAFSKSPEARTYNVEWASIILQPQNIKIRVTKAQQVTGFGERRKGFLTPLVGEVLISGFLRNSVAGAFSVWVGRRTFLQKVKPCSNSMRVWSHPWGRIFVVASFP